MDIDLPKGNGFDILEKVDFKNFDVVFTTSFNEFVVSAFEFSALQYLVKPITIEKLTSAIDRYLKKNSSISSNIDNNITNFKNILNNKTKKILISMEKGLELFNIDAIVRCEINGNYSSIYLCDKKHLLICKTLQILKKLLTNYNFIRINRKYLININ